MVLEMRDVAARMVALLVVAVGMLVSAGGVQYIQVSRRANWRALS